MEEFVTDATEHLEMPAARWAAAQNALDALRRTLGNGPIIQHLTCRWLLEGIYQLRALISSASSLHRWSFNELLCDNDDVRRAPLPDETIRHHLSVEHVGADDFHRLTHAYWMALRDAASTKVLNTDTDVEIMAALLRSKFLASCVVVSPPGQRRHSKVRYDGLCDYYNFNPPQGRYHGLQNIGACWAPGMV
ncbi:hypothetical protein KBD61_02220 [Patescibacteria group bacterium]|nr:hypothetical protein [Patescibacteria group bacterium]MBP9709824.1 hypothetical protein [Patescibacteria group bacterium]